jgi:hypothetical protein
MKSRGASLFIPLAVAVTLSVPLALIYRPFRYVTVALALAMLVVVVRVYLDQVFRDGWREAVGYYDELAAEHLDPGTRMQLYARVVGQPLTRGRWQASMRALSRDLRRATSDADYTTAFDLHRRRVRDDEG